VAVLEDQDEQAVGGADRGRFNAMATAGTTTVRKASTSRRKLSASTNAKTTGSQEATMSK
jgi:hypothetical protein